MSEHVWQLDSVSLPGDTQPRLDRVSVKLSTGVTSVVGYSGAGKTSLLNVLSELESPQSGSVSFHKPEGSFGLPIFWAPQNGGLWPHLTVAEHLSAVMNEKQKSSRQIGESIDRSLDQFDLSHRRLAHPDQLSRGEQSRLAIARLLAANPAVLLMDEPLAHVDPIRRPMYWRIIREHVSATGASLVFSTHEPEAAIRESHSVICLDTGRVKFAGATRQLYQEPPNQESAVFLGAINWFHSKESSIWLGESNVKGKGIRPENIKLEVSPEGSLEILSFQFSGSYAETKVRDSKTLKKRTILHRPVATAHEVGQRVFIRVIS